MSEDRPRPQYGEYASPEEQARAMGRSRPAVPSVAAHPSPSSDPAAVSPAPPAAAPARRWDVTLSAVLLMIGLYSVLSMFVTMAQLPAAITSTITAWGITQPFTSFHAASIVAVVVDIVYGVLWIAALAGTIVAVRRGRTAFWIPLTAGIAATLVCVLLLSALLARDPAVAAFVQKLSG